MPTPARTSRDQIVAAGRRLIESEGLDGLTMQRVAEVVGVRPPSLYKHVASRGELIRSISENVFEDLGRRLEQAVEGEDPRRDLSAVAHAMRGFAHMQPAAYGLIFARLPQGWRPARERVAKASAPVLRTTAALAGPDRGLEAARTLTAWIHGFVTMELAGAFQLGGDINQAFTFGIERITAALAMD